MTTTYRPSFSGGVPSLRHPDSVQTIPRIAVRPPVDLEVVIPAFNECRRLPGTLLAMTDFLSAQRCGARVVVVDNGSWDDTAAVVREFRGSPVEVVAVGCAEPGKGAAVMRGIRTSAARLVGFTDADLSTPLDTLSRAVAALDAGAVAAIASRYAPRSRLAVSQPLARRVGGRVFRSLARSLVPGVHDTQCGFKFFDRVAVVRALGRCRSTGFAFDVELLGQLHRDGGRIVEVPVVWSDDGRSTLRPLRDGVPAVLSLTRLHGRAALEQRRRRDVR
jgi:dolichyl-phosphate beta-glucosyltransferase